MSLNEYQKNYRRIAALRMAQLQRKLEAGTITAAKYDAEMNIVVNSAPEDANAAYWDVFWDEYEAQLKKLPTYAGHAAGYVANVVGTAAGGAVSGLFKGFANPTTIVLAVVVVVVVGWAFLKGPLKGTKVKSFSL